jgi:uncharacterized protein (DUF3084 family)
MIFEQMAYSTLYRRELLQRAEAAEARVRELEALQPLHDTTLAACRTLKAEIEQREQVITRLSEAYDQWLGEEESANSTERLEHAIWAVLEPYQGRRK